MYAFVFLVALSIDYNIFLMTRVREEGPQTPGRRAGTLSGLTVTGGVVASAGVVLRRYLLRPGRCCRWCSWPRSRSPAPGSLLDTLVVRSVLVTALTLDIGRRMWWPSCASRRDSTSADELPGQPPRTW